MLEFKVESERVNFWLRVKPRATHERLTVDAAGELRLEIHAPPTEGQANEACIAFLARALRVPTSCVEILSGEKSRRKLLRISGPSAEHTIARIQSLAESPKAGRGK